MTGRGPRCAAVFTDVYVCVLADTTPRIKLLASAPAALRPEDCLPAPIASP